MTKATLPTGEEITINAEACNLEFLQGLIALNDDITREINRQADGFLSEEGGRGNADSFKRLKALVDEMHALLSNTEFVEEAKALAVKKAAKKAKKGAAK
jgi:hypothetical protein